MASDRWPKKWENHIIAAAALAILLATVGFCFDYYFDLNDDALMRDILSGSYTGAPESRNIQMLFPLSLLLSLLYRLLPSVPWYGVFLFLCQYGSLYLIMERSLRFCGLRRSKCFLAIAQLALVWALLPYHLVFVQYTFACGLLACAALVWIATASLGETGKAPREASLIGDAKSASECGGIGSFLFHRLPALLLLCLAYLLRSEMLLLMLPFVAAALVFDVSSQGRFFSWRKLSGCLSFGALLGVGLLACQGLHFAGYSDASWREFLRFFDARTRIYDFQGVPPYEENAAFYESVGLTRPQQRLLENYNFGLDDAIDADCLEQIAAYGAPASDFAGRTGLRENLWLYGYRLFRNEPAGPRSDMPYNLILLASYLLALIAGLAARKRRVLIQLAVLFAGRSTLWLFIMAQGRDPVRITDPMYLAEILLLLSLAGRYCLTLPRVGGRRAICRGVSVLGCLALLTLFVAQEGKLAGAFPQWADTGRESKERARENESYAALLSFCDSHAGNFYFVDVYSTVTFSEKLWDASHTALNYDILGGWCCKSPLAAKKLERFGLPSVQEALLGDGVYLIAQDGAAMDWLSDFYSVKGIPVSVQRTERPGGLLSVYSVRRISGE